MRRFIFSLALLLPFAGSAQEIRPGDSTRNKFLPTGLRLGTDLLAIIQSRTSNKFSGWEVNADVDLTRYYLAFDYGKWGVQPSLKDGYYDNYGTYFRLGADVNFLLKDPDRNMFFLGGRYGKSHFTESIRFTIPDSTYGNAAVQKENPRVDAHWIELTGGLRVKIWKWLWAGYTARYKFALRSTGGSALKSYDVPGYGLTFRSNYWGFNYQLFIRIPLRKQR